MYYNKSFAKTEDGKILIFAPAQFEHGGIKYNATNREDIYNAIGFYKYVETEMPVKEGYYYSAYYEKNGNVLYQKWEEHKIEEAEK